MKFPIERRIFRTTAAILLIFAPACAFALHPEAETCLGCHPGPMKDLKDTKHGRMILQRFGSTPAACLTCHAAPYGNGRGAAHRISKVSPPKASVTRANQPGTCGSCHGIPGKAASLPNGRTALESYRLTVHGEAQAIGQNKAAACADCHGSHAIRAPGEPGSKVNKANIAATCGACHKEEARQFRGSIHGAVLAKGLMQAPTCTDCHGEHTIRSPKNGSSSVYRGAITRTCAGCHASARITEKFGVPADRVQTFLDSYHGLAGKSGDLKVANCASCHGWHDVLPASNPRSRVNAANLPTTCGQCHPNAGVDLSGKVHQALAMAGEASGIASLLRLFYLFLIPAVIGGMLLHNAIDLIRKAVSVPRLAHLKNEGAGPLLTVAERWQHAGLAITFASLAFSGFALKFPAAWDALGLSRLGGENTRLAAHRAAALLFVLVGVCHCGYLLLSRKGRERVFELLPARRDLSEPFQLVFFNLGLLKKRPLLSRWSYIEKAEYWALIWGSFVMIATGAILIFHNFAMAKFPFWVIESARVVHFMEAALACLGVIAWHFYWSIFDPDIYPMNWAWLKDRPRLPGRERGSHDGKEDENG